MAKTEMTAEYVMKRAMEVPTVDLPRYLKSYGDVLPGISRDRLQILTSAELNEMPESEALHCRILFIMTLMITAQSDGTQADLKTA